MATTHIPEDAYHDPTETELELNQEYFAAYTAIQPFIQRVAPDPGPYCQYGSDNAYSHYCQTYTEMKLPDVCLGFPVTFAVGVNAALWDGMTWLWENDPESPNNKPCE